MTIFHFGSSFTQKQLSCSLVRRGDEVGGFGEIRQHAPSKRFFLLFKGRKEGQASWFKRQMLGLLWEKKFPLANGREGG